jgi:diguanylate cyclase (GGDEF)-like protein/PAS domain S-box-containing protein
MQDGVPGPPDERAIERLRRRVERERSGRLQAEHIMEAKYRELYRANDQLRQLAEEVSMREEYSRAIFLAAYDGLITVDSVGRVEDANPAALTMLGFQAGDLSGKPLSDVLDLHVNGFAGELTQAQVLHAIEASISRETEMDARRQNGSTFPASITVGATTVWNAARYILVMRDLTHERAAEAALMRMAFIDPLTDLGNRYWIRREFEELAQEGDREVAMFYVNLDWFKRINDSLGHRVGDEALTIVARRIATPGEPAAAAYRYQASRMGGDEFGVLVSRGATSLDWQAVADDMRMRLAEPIELGGTSVTIGASVGFTASRVVTADFDRLVNEADIAMRRAKGEGNHGAQAYDESMGYRASGAVALEEGIRLGLARGEFVAHFQPKIELATGEIRGAEALVRWQHPEAGLLSPGEFLSTAEGSDLIADIGEIVLADVVGLLRRAIASGTARPIAVNVSSREFGSPALAGQIARVVAEAGIPPSLISIEVTEGVVAAEHEQFMLLRTLREAGFAVAIDDFGVAQSSLSRLRSIPMDEVKIDKSFVDRVPESSIDCNILRAVVSLGSATGAHVVIEGVERPEQLDFLRQLEPCLVQGFVYSRPVAADEFLVMLAEQPWLVRAG